MKIHYKGSASFSFGSKHAGTRCDFAALLHKSRPDVMDSYERWQPMNNDPSTTLPRFRSVAAGLLIFVIGCSSPVVVKEKVDPSIERLGKIVSAYMQASQKLQHPPQNVEDLMPFLKTMGDPKELLHSPQDNEAYVIIWGVDFSTLKPEGKGAPVIAYERNATAGERFVGTFPTNVVSMTTEQFNNAYFPAGHRPAD